MQSDFYKISILKQMIEILKKLVGIQTDLNKLKQQEAMNELITRIANEYLINPVKAIKVAVNESGLNPNAKNTKGNYPAGSVDRGLYQINSYWHAEITDEQAYDPEFSTRFFCQMVNKGRVREWMGAKGVFY